MRIGIDVQAGIGRVTGLGTYVNNLVPALQAAAPEDEFILMKSNHEGDWNTFQRLKWENCELPKQIKRGNVDLFHSPAFSPPFLKPRKIVMTLHDIIGITYSNQKGWPSRFYWKCWLPQMARRVDHLIVDSQHTKEDVIKHLGIPAEKMTVVHLACPGGFESESSSSDVKQMKSELGICGPYFLTVGTLEPRKNFKRVLQAFGQFKEDNRNKDYQLVIVGSKEFAHSTFFQEIAEEYSNLQKDVICTGYVEQKVLNTLYTGTHAFLFPSLYEGFGLPVLEGMQRQAPVLTSNTTSIPEVAGDAAYLVDPTSVEAIHEGMLKLAYNDDLRRDLINCGNQQVKKFSWEKTAQETLAVYRQMIR